MNICPYVPHGQTERQKDTKTGVMNLMTAFRNVANYPKKDDISISSLI
jgi:hypothetical protein